MGYLRLALLTLFAIAVSGCATSPPPSSISADTLNETNMPFPQKAYQATKGDVVQMALSPNQHVAIIQSEPEYVIWKKPAPVAEVVGNLDAGADMAETQNPVEAGIAQALLEPEKAPEHCLPIYCDKDFKPCGKVKWCGDEACNDRQKGRYTCSGTSCEPTYQKDDPAGERVDCTQAKYRAHPLCDGKDDIGCDNAPELFRCNPEGDCS